MKNIFATFMIASTLIGCASKPTYAPAPTRYFTSQNVLALNNIEVGMTRAQVIAFFGAAPFNRDINGQHEVLQWCNTNPGAKDDYAVVWLTNGVVKNLTRRSHMADRDCKDSPVPINFRTPDAVIENRSR